MRRLSRVLLAGNLIAAVHGSARNIAIGINFEMGDKRLSSKKPATKRHMFTWLQ
jgi:hypothetical protein